MVLSPYSPAISSFDKQGASFLHRSQSDITILDVSINVRTKLSQMFQFFSKIVTPYKSMATVDNLKNQAFSRRLYDGGKMTDDLRVQTGPGRYQLDAPPQYCNATYAPEPTVRLQKWGASQNSQYAKTDVESDLFNINRPTTKNVNGQYNPATDKVNKATAVPAKEESFPNTFSRLVDPPCTLRSSGWNRWEWLCDNPQEGVMIPFDWNVTSRLQQKDQFRPCIPKPIDSAVLLPAPNAYDKSVGKFEGLDQDSLSEIKASTKRAIAQFPRGEDVLPAAPTALFGVQPAPVLPPSIAMGSRANIGNL